MFFEYASYDIEKPVIRELRAHLYEEFIDTHAYADWYNSDCASTESLYDMGKRQELRSAICRVFAEKEVKSFPRGS